MTVARRVLSVLSEFLGIPELLSRAGYDSWHKYGTLGFNKRPFLTASDHTNDMDDSAQLV